MNHYAKEFTTTYLQTSTNVATEKIKSKRFFLLCPRLAKMWGASSTLTTWSWTPFSTLFCAVVMLFLSTGDWTLGLLVKSAGSAWSDIRSCYRVSLNQKSTAMLSVTWSHGGSYIFWISMLRKRALGEINDARRSHRPSTTTPSNESWLTFFCCYRRASGCALEVAFRSAPVSA